jgi:MerR family redox-sensitive transcriptional activator SoxR
MPHELAIGEVAERAGMSTSRIRYYEARGLLPEAERTAGKRRYGEDVFRRLQPLRLRVHRRVPHLR